MLFSNDPTSCNDLKLTLLIMTLIILSVFAWLYERGNQAITISYEHQLNNEQLVKSKVQQQETIQSLQSILQTLKSKNKSLRDKNTSAEKAMELTKSLFQQEKQHFETEKLQLNEQISSLTQQQIDNQNQINKLQQQQTDNVLKTETTEQTLQESRQLSQQQFLEYKKLKRELAQVKFEAEQRLKAINEWQVEVSDLKKQLSDTEIKIIQSKQRFTVFEMDQDILFGKGQTTLKVEGHKILTRLADIFRQYPNRQIAIQGHSDAQALGARLKQKYASNWGLAAARAASAIHYLQNQQAINPQRIILVSYAHYRPKLKGEKAEDFAANRRIEITLLPEGFDLLREGSE